jgi:cell volume regulation protein A
MMTVAIAFALIGGVILIGFLANLLFRATKIPSVLILIAIGVLLGPVAGWITSNSLITIAPFLGALALLIILFEGGLELDISTVVRQAPKASALAVLAFIFSVGSVAAFAYFAAGYTPLNSFLISCILGATSPAICIPLVSGLSVREEIKTFLKLESALGDVLLLVSVLLIIDVHFSGRQDVIGMAGSFAMSIGVAFAVSSIAGVLWSRLIGWMGGEPLAYMLTLGFVFLLYFAVEELHGSAAIAVLMFGLMLENMQIIAGRMGERVRQLFGIDIRAEQFVLNQFMKNITQELSFLVRTFFFVYLGLLLNFKTFSLRTCLSGFAIVILLLVSRWMAIQLLKRRMRLSSGETQTVMALLPRGLATAVMAFLPGQSGLPGVELFPVYAFIVIVLTNLFMTAGILFSERQLMREGGAVPHAGRGDREAVDTVMMEKTPPASQPSFSTVDGLNISPNPFESIIEPDSRRLDGSTRASFADWAARIFGIRLQERESRYIEAIRASSLADFPFWVEIVLATVLTGLGLVLNQSAIIIGASLIVPFVWPVLAAGLALAVGDVYLLLKLLLKFVLVVALVAILSAVFTYLLPFNTVTAEIAARSRPTILDFLVALFAGIAGAGLFSARKRILHYLPGALIAITLLPPLTVMGLSLGKGFGAEIFRGSALLFTANFFAVILGASMVFAAIGMPRIGDMEFIRVWKRREFERPIIRFAFNRIGLLQFVGRTGSLRSRLIVTLVFLIALIIPLQMAFNQLSLEFRARQAISDMEKMFVQPGRSEIINSRANIYDDRIEVRIQVATNSFFTAADMQKFEQRISDRIGKPSHLDLVQSVSDVGEGKTIRAMLAPVQADPAAKAEDLNASIAELRSTFENKLRTVPFPPSIHLLSASAELALIGKAPVFSLVYLADARMAEDTRTLLVRWMEREMLLTPGSIQLTYVAAKYEFEINAGGELGEIGESRLREIHGLLDRYPQLQVQIDLPGRARARTLAALQKAIGALLALPKDSPRAVIQSSPEETNHLTITLRMVPVQSPPQVGH